MPLFNKDRLRCGDLVAGTIVVKAPVAVLLGDLTDRGVGRPAERPERPAARWSPPPSTPAFAPEPVAEEFPFTRQQLDIYGIHKLQVLEDLLRRDDQGVLDGSILEEVCDKIKTKIGWPRERWDVQPRPLPRRLLPGRSGRGWSRRCSSGSGRSGRRGSLYPRFTTTTVTSSGAASAPRWRRQSLSRASTISTARAVPHGPHHLAGALEAVGVAVAVQRLEQAVGAEDEGASARQPEIAVGVGLHGAAAERQAGEVDLGHPAGLHDQRIGVAGVGEPGVAGLRVEPDEGEAGEAVVRADAAQHLVELAAARWPGSRPSRRGSAIPP